MLSVNGRWVSVPPLLDREDSTRYSLFTGFHRPADTHILEETSVDQLPAAGDDCGGWAAEPFLHTVNDEIGAHLDEIGKIGRVGRVDDDGNTSFFARTDEGLQWKQVRRKDISHNENRGSRFIVQGVFQVKGRTIKSFANFYRFGTRHSDYLSDRGIPRAGYVPFLNHHVPFAPPDVRKGLDSRHIVTGQRCRYRYRNTCRGTSRHTARFSAGQIRDRLARPSLKFINIKRTIHHIVNILPNPLRYSRCSKHRCRATGVDYAPYTQAIVYVHPIFPFPASPAVCTTLPVSIDSIQAETISKLCIDRSNPVSGSSFRST